MIKQDVMEKFDSVSYSSISRTMDRCLFGLSLLVFCLASLTITLASPLKTHLSQISSQQNFESSPIPLKLGVTINNHRNFGVVLEAINTIVINHPDKVIINDANKSKQESNRHVAQLFFDDIDEQEKTDFPEIFFRNNNYLTKYKIRQELLRVANNLRMLPEETLTALAQYVNGMVKKVVDKSLGELRNYSMKKRKGEPSSSSSTSLVNEIVEIIKDTVTLAKRKTAREFQNNNLWDFYELTEAVRKQVLENSAICNRHGSHERSNILEQVFGFFGSAKVTPMMDDMVEVETLLHRIMEIHSYNEKSTSYPEINKEEQEAFFQGLNEENSIIDDNVQEDNDLEIKTTVIPGEALGLVSIEPVTWRISNNFSEKGNYATDEKIIEDVFDHTIEDRDMIFNRKYQNTFIEEKNTLAPVTEIDESESQDTEISRASENETLSAEIENSTDSNSKNSIYLEPNKVSMNFDGKKNENHTESLVKAPDIGTTMRFGSDEVYNIMSHEKNSNDILDHRPKKSSFSQEKIKNKIIRNEGFGHRNEGNNFRVVKDPKKNIILLEDARKSFSRSEPEINESSELSEKFTGESLAELNDEKSRRKQHAMDIILESINDIIGGNMTNWMMTTTRGKSLR